jgi:transcription antitermination factor NusG
MAKRWYIVHAYSNFEHKVAESIREQAAQTGLEGAFEEILVPTEEVVEMRRGRRVNSERKFFPGYVLVKMDMTDDAYHLVKNTPKVTGFLGSQSKPAPISQSEVDRIVNQVEDGASGPSPLLFSKWARKFAYATARLLHSAALSKRSMKKRHGSKWLCQFSVGQPRSSWSTGRSKKAEPRECSWQAEQTAPPRPIIVSRFGGKKGTRDGKKD